MNLSTPPQAGGDRPILCFYFNTTSHLQVARISNIPNWYFERVVFPGQQLMFESWPQAELEIYQGTAFGAMLFNQITCDQLRVDEGGEEIAAPLMELAS